MSVLRSLSLTVADAEAVVITGSCSTGKSTIVQLLQGLTQPDAGEVWVAERNLGKLSTGSLPYVRRNIGVVAQSQPSEPFGGLVPYWTVAENVALPLAILRLRSVECAYKVEATLDKCDVTEVRDVRVDELDAALRARVALARAIATDPDILLCDEPTAGLDPLAALDLLERIADLHRGRTTYYDDGTAKKLTLLVTTHQPEVIRFAHHAGWRRERLVDGQLLDQLPGPRPATLDDETEAFTQQNVRALVVRTDDTQPVGEP
jgi:cell division transport system ATP-binding protein